VPDQPRHGGLCASLERRLRRCWSEAEVAWIASQDEAEGPCRWRGSGAYWRESDAEPWDLLGRHIAAADVAVARLLASARSGDSTRPTAAEVLGVVLQLLGAAAGIVSDVVRGRR
jgi:hypothetical protein